MYSLILAGGIGSRMGNLDIPKQFLEIGNKPIFIHTLEKFLLVNEFEKNILVMNENWIDHAQNLLKKYNVPMDKIEIISGGGERNDTILNGLDFIRDTYGDVNPIVVTHDAVRPFVTLDIIYENINLAKQGVTVDTVIPAVDTIVECEDSSIVQIPDRSRIYQGQTPQTFKADEFRQSFLSLDESKKAILTDACKVLLEAGYEVKTVMGATTNIKITTKPDLSYARFLLEEK